MAMIVDIKNQDQLYMSRGRRGCINTAWMGANIDTVMPIVNLLKTHFKVYAVDLPGFGKSGKPKEVFGSEDYASCKGIS